MSTKGSATKIRKSRMPMPSSFSGNKKFVGSNGSLSSTDESQITKSHKGNLPKSKFKVPSVPSQKSSNKISRSADCVSNGKNSKTSQLDDSSTSTCTSTTSKAMPPFRFRITDEHLAPQRETLESLIGYLSDLCTRTENQLQTLNNSCSQMSVFIDKLESILPACAFQQDGFSDSENRFSSSDSKTSRLSEPFEPCLADNADAEVKEEKQELHVPETLTLIERPEVGNSPTKEQISTSETVTLDDDESGLGYETVEFLKIEELCAKMEAVSNGKDLSWTDLKGSVTCIEESELKFQQVEVSCPLETDVEDIHVDDKTMKNSQEDIHVVVSNTSLDEEINQSVSDDKADAIEMDVSRYEYGYGRDTQYFSCNNSVVITEEVSEKVDFSVLQELDITKKPVFDLMNINSGCLDDLSMMTLPIHEANCSTWLDIDKKMFGNLKDELSSVTVNNVQLIDNCLKEETVVINKTNLQSEDLVEHVDKDYVEQEQEHVGSMTLLLSEIEMLTPNKTLYNPSNHTRYNLLSKTWINNSFDSEESMSENIDFYQARLQEKNVNSLEISPVRDNAENINKLPKASGFKDQETIQPISNSEFLNLSKPMFNNASIKKVADVHVSEVGKTNTSVSVSTKLTESEERVENKDTKTYMHLQEKNLNSLERNISPKSNLSSATHVDNTSKVKVNDSVLPDASKDRELTNTNKVLLNLSKPILNNSSISKSQAVHVGEVTSNKANMNVSTKLVEIEERVSENTSQTIQSGSQQENGEENLPDGCIQS